MRFVLSMFSNYEFSLLMEFMTDTKMYVNIEKLAVHHILIEVTKFQTDRKTKVIRHPVTRCIENLEY